MSDYCEVCDECELCDDCEDSQYSDTEDESGVEIGDKYHLKIKPVKMSQSIYGGRTVGFKNMTLAVFCCDRPENPEDPASEDPILLIGEGEINFHSDGKGGIRTPEGERYYGKVSTAAKAKWARLCVKGDDVTQEDHFNPRIDMDIVDFPDCSGLFILNSQLDPDCEVTLQSISFQGPGFIQWQGEEQEEKTDGSVDWPTAIGIATIAATIASILVWFLVGPSA